MPPKNQLGSSRHGYHPTRTPTPSRAKKEAPSEQKRDESRSALGGTTHVPVTLRGDSQSQASGAGRSSANGTRAKQATHWDRIRARDAAAAAAAAANTDGHGDDGVKNKNKNDAEVLSSWPPPPPPAAGRRAAAHDQPLAVISPLSGEPKEMVGLRAKMQPKPPPPPPAKGRAAAAAASAATATAIATTAGEAVLSETVEPFGTPLRRAPAPSTLAQKRPNDSSDGIGNEDKREEDHSSPVLAGARKRLRTASTAANSNGTEDDESDQETPLLFDTADKPSTDIAADGLPVFRLCIEFAAAENDRRSRPLWLRGASNQHVLVFDRQARALCFAMFENSDLSSPSLAELVHERRSGRRWTVPYTMIEKVEVDIVSSRIHFQCVPPERQCELSALDFPHPIRSIVCSYHVNFIHKQLWNELNVSGASDASPHFIEVDEHNSLRDRFASHFEGLENKALAFAAKTPTPTRSLAAGASSPSERFFVSSRLPPVSSKGFYSAAASRPMASKTLGLSWPSRDKLEPRSFARAPSSPVFVDLDEMPSPVRQQDRLFEGQTASDGDDECLRVVRRSQRFKKDGVELTRVFVYAPALGVNLRIDNSDLLRLTPGEFLNDVVIEFYIRYLIHEVFTEVQQQSIHVFSTFFFNKLMSGGKSGKPGEALKSARYQTVKKWSGSVDIFEKDYLFIPINLNAHWLLLVVCHCGQYARRYIAEMNEDLILNETNNEQGADSGKEGLPCLIFFDSLGSTKREDAASAVKDYLTYEWRAKKPDQPPVDFGRMQTSTVNPPQQDNYCDCGVFLLHYLELFVKDPRTGRAAKRNWFAIEDAVDKREVIRNLIVQKAAGTAPAVDDASAVSEGTGEENDLDIFVPSESAAAEETCEDVPTTVPMESFE